jgi:Co/Zn/Cd efflux system component
VWNIDSNEIFLSAHILTKNLSQSDDLIKEINEFLDIKYGIHKTSLQIENNICHH